MKQFSIEFLGALFIIFEKTENKLLDEFKNNKCSSVQNDKTELCHSNTMCKKLSIDTLLMICFSTATVLLGVYRSLPVC